MHTAMAEPRILRETPPRRLSALHIPALDGLRGLAILAVLLFKSSEGFQASTLSGKAVGQVFGFGWAGVDLFFVLSGFLISGILLDTRGQPHYFRNFYARRTLRVFPLYYGVLLLSFVLLPRFLPAHGPGMARIVRNQGWLWTYTTNIAFLVKRSVFFDAGWLRFNHFWSLAIEEQFYLVWPLLIFLLSRRRLAIACWMLVGGALMLRVALYLAHQRPGAMFYPTPCRTDSLAIGALLAIGIRGPLGIENLSRLAKKGAIVSGLALVAVGIWRKKQDVNDITTLTFGFTLLAVFAGSILALALKPSGSSRWVDLLELRPLRLLGKYSYAMYVLHMWVIVALDRRFSLGWFVAHTRAEALGVVLHAAAFCGATFAVGFLSWHLYEKHFLKAKRFFPDRAPAPAA
jgi:peptidoglycan/LPS O-acetylase OafA/YrhL